MLVAAADCWWINCLAEEDLQALLVLRSGAVFAKGGTRELLAQDLPELSSLQLPAPPPVAAGNPQDEEQRGGPSWRVLACLGTNGCLSTFLILDGPRRCFPSVSHEIPLQSRRKWTLTSPTHDRRTPLRGMSRGPTLCACRTCRR